MLEDAELTEEERKMIKRKTCFTVIYLSFFAILALAVLVWYQYTHVFTKWRWQHCDDSKKHRYMASLERKHELIGLDEEELVALLGRPNSIVDESNTKVWMAYHYNDADVYYCYRVDDDFVVGWRILLIGFRDGIAIDYKITEENW